MRITVAIPCIPRHVQYMPRVLASVRNQTTPAFEVIVSICNTTAAEAQAYETAWRKLLPETIQLRILHHPNSLRAGPNRNEAARVARGDILTFFDADDEMHPQRLEAIVHVFTRFPDTKLFLHNFFCGRVNRGFQSFNVATMACIRSPRTFTATFGDPPVDDPRRLTLPPPGPGAYNVHFLFDDGRETPVHHGHVTVPKVVFDEAGIQFPNIFPGEDGSFCRSVLWHYPENAVCTPTKLSWYNS